MDRIKLFEENERLAYFALNKYFPGHAFDEDMVQVAKLGLWKACRTYDPEKTKFATYAVVCIRNEIFIAMRSRSPACSVSLDQKISLEDSEGNTLQDFLSDPQAVVAMRNAEFDFAQALKRCSAEQKKMIALRLAGKSQVEIGWRVGCTQSKVSRELRRACDRMFGGAANA